MKRYLALPLLLIVLSTVPRLHAEIPLVLVGEAIIPPGASWDLQWVDEAYTLAWVSVFQQTVQWAELPGGAMQQMTVEVDLDTLNNGWNFIEWNGSPTVAWVRWPGAPNDRCVLWQRTLRCGFDQDFWYFERHLIVILNLSTYQILGHSFVSAGGYYYGYVSGDEASSSIGPLQVTPPLPAISEYLVFATHRTTSFWRPGDYDSQEEYSWLFAVPVARAMSESLLTPEFEADTALFFTDSLYTFAFGGRHTIRSYWEDGSNYETSWWIGVRRIGGATQRDSLHGAMAMPQQDTDGTRRLILPGARTLNAATFDSLWRNDEIGGEFFVARQAGGEERIFAYSDTSNRFLAFRGSNGQFLEETSPVEGHFRRVLKGSPEIHAVLTFNDATRTARVYQFAPDRIPGLTCRYDAEISRVVLTWPSAHGAAGYHVWMSYQAGEWGQEIARVSGTVHSIGFVPPVGQRFFHVTVEY